MRKVGSSAASRDDRSRQMIWKLNRQRSSNHRQAVLVRLFVVAEGLFQAAEHFGCDFGYRLPSGLLSR
ncbi:hypothetical protein IE4872_PD00978 (plasmid) [Rhizobium gallicum]|uniref:Uncharacterized protein n=1 Tax=Rhizobium gallicum TaxID=56730 RepID=A0A1L5NUC1_9HYPH|nr:hypothetical protein IE4872_PD00978 [Rhizobium gallicum]